MRRKFSPVRMIIHISKLPKGMVESSSLDIFRTLCQGPVQLDLNFEAGPDLTWKKSMYWKTKKNGCCDTSFLLISSVNLWNRYARLNQSPVVKYLHTAGYVMAFHRYSIPWHHAVNCQSRDGCYRAAVPGALVIPMWFLGERRWYNHGRLLAILPNCSTVKRHLSFPFVNLLPLIPFIFCYFTFLYDF